MTFCGSSTLPAKGGGEGWEMGDKEGKPPNLPKIWFIFFTHTSTEKNAKYFAKYSYHFWRVLELEIGAGFHYLNEGIKMTTDQHI